MEQHNAVVLDECKTSNEWTFGQDWSNKYESAIKPKFNNLKEEVLCNSFAPISKEKWNDILKKVTSIMNFKAGCKKRSQFSRLLKEHKIKTKHMVALKCYTDSDALQCEMRKCFLPHTQSTKQYIARMSEFFHWRRTLQQAFCALSKLQNNTVCVAKGNMLYHGIKCKSIIKQRECVFDGPLSCTTDINIARDFAGKYGMILAIKPLQSEYEMLDVSLISDFPHEREVLLFNHKIEIASIIIAEDYDNNYAWFKQEYVTPARERCHRRSNSLTEVAMIEKLDCKQPEPLHDKTEELVTIGAVDKDLQGLLITQSCLLLSVYEYCQLFISNLTKFTQKRIYDSKQQQEMYDRLKQFKALQVQKEIYEQFLNQHQIDHAQFNKVFSEYMRISA